MQIVVLSEYSCSQFTCILAQVSNTQTMVKTTSINIIPRNANVVITFGTVNRELSKSFSVSPEGVGMIARVRIWSSVGPAEVGVGNRVVALVFELSASPAKVEVSACVGLDFETTSLIMLGRKLIFISAWGVELASTVRSAGRRGVRTDVDST